MLRRAFSTAAKSGKKYVLTGVDGFLGGAAAKFALEIAQPNDQLGFTSYKLDALPKEQVAQWKKQGVQVEAASYNDIEQLSRVFDGAEAVSFISTWEFGGRRRQAHNVCDAAKNAGVKRVCYTSFVGADSTLPEEQMSFLPRDHRVNERIIRESGLQYSIQRDFLYQDYIALKRCDAWKFCGDRWLNNSHGVPGAYVARQDCGNALAALLLGKGEPNSIYDITGPEAVTDLEIFRWMCAQTGYKATFTDMEDAEMRQWWIDHGMPTEQHNADYSKVPLKMCVDDLLSAGETVANGSMRKPSDAVEKLTGRKPQDFRETLLQYKYKFPTPE